MSDSLLRAIYACQVLRGFLVDVGTASSQGGPILEQGPGDWEKDQRQEAEETCRPFNSQLLVHYFLVY